MSTTLPATATAAPSASARAARRISTSRLLAWAILGLMLFITLAGQSPQARESD